MNCKDDNTTMRFYSAKDDDGNDLTGWQCFTCNHIHFLRDCYCKWCREDKS